MATDTTANGGYYLFDYLEAGDYVVVLPAGNFASGAVLEGYYSSATTRNADGSLAESSAPDADNDTDNDDNGTAQTSGSFNGAVISSAVTLGGTEPSGEGDTESGVGQGSQPDAQANMTVDFGFYTMTLGDLVWDDTDNSGAVNGAEAGIDNVSVELWTADGNTRLATTTTSGGGQYLFDGLAQGSYIVRIPDTEFQGTGTLRNYYSSTGGGSEPAPNPDSDFDDNDDNGSEVGTLGYAGGYIQTDVFALTPGAEAASNNATGTTSETRVDFGVFNSPKADLAITKDDGQTFYLQGGTLTYTVVVSNAGPADVSDALVSDTIPSQFTSWDWACTAANGGATGCDAVSGSTSDFSDTLSLPIGSSVTYTVTATVSNTASGTLTNTAAVSSATIADTNNANDSATDVDEPASLTITKDDGQTVVSPGATFTYVINIANNGAVNLSTVSVSDALPADLVYVSASPAPVDPAATPLVWNIGTLNAGDTAQIQLTVRVVDSPSSSSITNTATVSDSNTGATASADDTDAIAADNTKTFTGSNQSDSTDPEVFIGEVLTYQISIPIPDGVTMTGLTASDVLDAGLAFDECVSVSYGSLTTDRAGGFAAACPTGGDATNPDPVVTNEGHNVLMSFGNVTNASGSEQTLTVTYLVDVLNVLSNVNGVGNIDNHVTWSWNGGSSTLSDSADSVEIIEPDLSIEKTASPQVSPLGNPITFTVDIAHTVASTADAYDVVVTDTLPDGLEYVNGSIAFTGTSPTTVDYDAATKTLMVTWDHFPLLATSSFTFDAIFVGPSDTINEVSVAWTSIPLDPGVQSEYNLHSTERWYDPNDQTGLNGYGVSSGIRISVPRLPETGFAPDRVTSIPSQPEAKEYQDLGDLWLEIPRLNLQLPIVGVPLRDDGWDLTWLWDEAGWLEGTAYPSWAGNTVLTAHVYLPNGEPGPFVNLHTLYWGDTVILHANGQRYIYQVRSTRRVYPGDTSIINHEDEDWLTLLTCQGYNERKDAYDYRIVVRAVLLKVEPEP